MFTNKLSSEYPYIKVHLGKYICETQPIFSYPVIRPMTIAPSANELLLAELSPKIVSCFSEPPWIKRCNFGIKFTDEIQMVGSIAESRASEKEEAKRIKKEKKAKMKAEQQKNIENAFNNLNKNAQNKAFSAGNIFDSNNNI